MTLETELPRQIDTFLEECLLPEDEALSTSRARSEQMGLVPHAVSPLQGAFLHILAKSVTAKRILEIGTLGGYSAIWLARALPKDGKMISLEIVPSNRAVALQNIADADLSDRIEVRLGPAGALLDDMIEDGEDPFDLIFIDADKSSFPDYWRKALRLSRVGTLIILDNVVRGGAVIDATSKDNSVIGVRATLRLIEKTPGVMATALQTVGAKGHDGFALAIVEQPGTAQA